jgi:hypothetical protein
MSILSLYRCGKKLTVIRGIIEKEVQDLYGKR